MRRAQSEQSRNLLLRRYVGRNAIEYEARRGGTERYEAEQRAFEALYTEARPRSVLDAPFGTGRFLPFYERDSVAVVGIDLSQDMLAVANRKRGTQQSLVLKVGDILDAATYVGMRGKFDLVVSVRFLNWLPVQDMQQAVQNFTALEPRHLLLGAQVSCESAESSMRGFSLNRLRRAAQTALGLRARVFVHDEQAIFCLLADVGFELQASREIGRKTGVANRFYLFKQEICPRRTET
jgi:SAM-dependent methyltransferase